MKNFKVLSIIIGICSIIFPKLFIKNIMHALIISPYWWKGIIVGVALACFDHFYSSIAPRLIGLVARIDDLGVKIDGVFNACDRSHGVLNFDWMLRVTLIYVGHHSCHVETSSQKHLQLFYARGETLRVHYKIHIKGWLLI